MRTGVGKASVICLKGQGSETLKEFSKLTGLRVVQKALSELVRSCTVVSQEEAADFPQLIVLKHCKRKRSCCPCELHAWDNLDSCGIKPCTWPV